MCFNKFVVKLYIAVVFAPTLKKNVVFMLARAFDRIFEEIKKKISLDGFLVRPFLKKNIFRGMKHRSTSF